MQKKRDTHIYKLPKEETKLGVTEHSINFSLYIEIITVTVHQMVKAVGFLLFLMEW